MCVCECKHSVSYIRASEGFWDVSVGPTSDGMVQTGTDASCWGPCGNRKLPTGVLALWWGLGFTSREPVPAMREAPALSAVQDATALARVYQPAWTELGKNWKTKAPSPQSAVPPCRGMREAGKRREAEEEGGGRCRRSAGTQK